MNLPGGKEIPPWVVEQLALVYRGKLQVLLDKMIYETDEARLRQYQGRAAQLREMISELES